MTELASQSVAGSRASVVRLVGPTDAKFTGTVLGGEILAEIDRVDFLSPVHIGQIVEFDAALTSFRRSSMEISAEVRAEDLKQGRSRIDGRALVSMMGVDERGRPVTILPLELTNEDERRLVEEGRQRIESRRRSRTPESGM